ncbi:hypothetical protein OnM2_076051 [Erysiphe neolycopersici]|uniref:Class I SAM-dependent methyltransferase n=1 Tax=Erysiphe neolycopersici TaxID=212602 RepID=A0A420HIF2_9PEZI|nr:hypothetical protein OnM2_076051 [Erysiphe neolycopersici]
MTSLASSQILLRKMNTISPRIQFFEITDQEWFPGYLRERIQSCLTFFWTLKIPLLQESSAAQLVAQTLCQVLVDARRYRYVDFCAGAGGPTPTIEQELNSQLASHYSFTEMKNRTKAPAHFVLTDLHPHIPEWTRISKHAENISFISESVDATCAPSSVKSNDEQKIFRFFNLSFHHFDDQLATDILRNSFNTADGFGIFELQDRTFSSLLMIIMLAIVLLLATPFYFWRSPGHSLFTYVIPILPIVILVDGWISCLRTRTSKEVLDLIEKCSAPLNDWTIISEQEQLSLGIGHMSWIVAEKKIIKSQPV